MGGLGRQGCSSHRSSWLNMVPLGLTKENLRKQSSDTSTHLWYIWQKASSAEQSGEVAGRLKKSSVGMVAANSRKGMVVNMV